MAHWIIGDVHGCWFTLQRLLERIEWQPSRDRLWLLGDLVNKGRHSLKVLRWAASLDKGNDSLLGNLDLHLLARAEGLVEERPEDTIEDILNAPDRDDLVKWMRRRPMLLRSGDLVAVHAGLMPSWKIKKAETLAKSCSRALKKGGIGVLWANRKTAWRPGLRGMSKKAAAMSVFTRVRVVGTDRQPLLKFSGRLENAPAGARPWFEGARVLDQGFRVVFGHWGYLGVYQVPGVLCLDSGCVYGGSLSAYRVDDGALIQERCAPKDRVSL
ncbi:MAG: symmetrical bis(5'-nucleosyl)-tetraphosphatase [Thermoanaerobaculales bacterium]|nr:symmetrical bis(5'-nucleosyl)-tetraphosphatase [Thermoanaerobaculales bacterium]